VRGLDLDLFDFDYDLTWMALFLTADGVVLGRYGGREPASPDARLSIPGLRHAMRSARAAFFSGGGVLPDRPADGPRTVERLPAARRHPPDACFHCHHVYDLRRESLQAAGRWSLDEVWVYPQPQNVGLDVDPVRGDTVSKVTPGTAAARLGLRVGDRLLSVNGLPVATFADLQYALHKAPRSGGAEVAWRRGKEEMTGRLELADGWRRTDVSWRWSLRGVGPQTGVDGDDLDDDQRQALGLAPGRLALRQHAFVSPSGRQAGVKAGDIIVGLDGRRPEMTARQFPAHLRLNYRPGDRVTLHVLRDGQPLDLTLTLEGRGRE
jgi:membrane-associated protease RseP (regulator of RpoE activity)